MTAQTSQSPPQNAERRLDLDWIRIGAFGLLILYHTGMLYVSWGFHVKSAHLLRELEPVMLLLNPWRMALLFLVSGAATRFMLGKYEVGALARRRTAQLLIPLVFGMLVVVPPQSWAEIVEKLGYSGSYPDFWIGHYLAFDQGFCRIENGRQSCLILPTWNHLWFVAYLFLYTMALAGLIALAPSLPLRGERRLERCLPGMLLLLGPALLLGLNRFLVFPAAPPNHIFIGDWYQHVLYGFCFLFGFLAARSRVLAERTEQLRWLALVLAVAAIIAMLWLRAQPPGELRRLAGPFVYGLDQWCWIVAILGFARRHLSRRDGPVRRYLVEAVFCWYIVHQTAIILAAHWLKPLALPAGPEASLVIAIAALSCAASYEITRRIGWLRPLFGIAADRRKRLPASGLQPSSASATSS
ncbi:Acyltransferase family protein [Bosea sp. 62]|uniref:acyltransferase family protein n=1 Tax=unclassified Bosea (in: a-proteobacteria) TaxID=2653178 RepID=UPI0012512D39|nr:MULTISPECIES: acyltransferase family protein [unclassified Bosea (in: a-proteobacteria)]CAD5254086.1 Acyltransferase family protein [Bosea sp. 21B]CAD5286600.1 Acyltransferase family protein [Bosea sp. 7B]CAD5301297.1 Acyltransferase family protein [Bosea sp. 46]VVT57394.1 Acyltransferase family protein [Bosea sp. EC-HK365B]VXB67779.1 Acyltransferase family protein [Bosea sp. 125]